MLTPEGRIKAQAEYDERIAQIDAAVLACPACKGTKTRNAKGKTNKTECEKHRSDYRLAWVCSPLSETYWAS